MRTGEDLLPTHEEVVRVRQCLSGRISVVSYQLAYGEWTYRVVRVGHGIEWSERHGEFVDDEVVSIVLRLDEHAQTLLVLGTVS